MTWQTPVYDRSQEDVERAKELLSEGSFDNLTESEQLEYLAGLKGSLNPNDLTRIWNNLKILADTYEVSLTIPSAPLVLTLDYMRKVEEAVELIRGQQKVFSTTPQTPAQPYTDYEKWNDIEKIISDVYRLLTNNFFIYCGESEYAGDSVGLI